MQENCPSVFVTQDPPVINGAGGRRHRRKPFERRYYVPTWTTRPDSVSGPPFSRHRSPTSSFPSSLPLPFFFRKVAPHISTPDSRLPPPLSQMRTPPLRLRLHLRPRHLSPARRCFPNSSRIVDLIQHDEEHDTSPAVLNHIHLSSSQDLFPSYAAASEIQSQIRQVFLSYKAAAAATPAPFPVLLSFTPTPTYTLGRRQTSISTAQASRLRQPLRVPLPLPGNHPPEATATDASPPPRTNTKDYIPAVIETDRGGLTTYHGPGQIVLWPILDLRSPLHTPFTVRRYARLLEETTSALLLDLGIQTHLSEADPGVWVRRTEQDGTENQTDQQGDRPPGATDRKIAALGVHLRRHVTGLGTALNLDVATRGPESVNPWARFVPCGLNGKGVTSVRDLTGADRWPAAVANPGGTAVALAEDMARRWAAELSSRLGLGGRVRSTNIAVESITTVS
ncbi:hypothetical protein ACRALDRAFT_1069973 [Sodiomyces alcalophilus JCM 7366]|uniref:uncharacterized protein n=1 Tax=Sodiomyces alcalophilus JCM 7366 TaxID=591952 RepID=UPI0039B5862A